MSEMSAEKRRAWYRAGSAISVVVVLILVLYQQTVLYLVGLWNQYETGNYAHGYLVLAISAYLIAINRKKLAAMMPCPNHLALPMVLAASLLWLTAVLVDVNTVQVVGLLLLLLAVTWVVLGNQVARHLVFPILFLGFAIPIWFPLSPVLQKLTADVVFWAIRLVEVPAARQENLIILQAGTLAVEESCSGLRYLIAALTLGTLYAYLTYRTIRARMVVVIVAACAALLANFLRVFIVVYLAHTTDMQHPYVQDHMMLGWYLFGGLVILMLVIDAGMRRHVVRDHHPGTRPANSMEHSNAGVCDKDLLKYTVVVFASVLLLSVGPVAAYRVENHSGQEIAAIEIRFPESTGDWRVQPGLSDDWMPVYHGATDHKQLYQRRDETVSFYAGCYGSQQQGSELINQLNRISNENVWRMLYPQGRLYDTGTYRVLEQLLEADNGQQKLVWYWFNITDRMVTSGYEAKIRQLLALLTGNPRACVLAVATEARDQEAARDRLYEFAFEPGPIDAGLFD